MKLTIFDQLKADITMRWKDLASTYILSQWVMRCFYFCSQCIGMSKRRCPWITFIIITLTIMTPPQLELVQVYQSNNHSQIQNLKHDSLTDSLWDCRMNIQCCPLEPAIKIRSSIAPLVQLVLYNYNEKQNSFPVNNAVLMAWQVTYFFQSTILGCFSIANITFRVTSLKTHRIRSQGWHHSWLTMSSPHDPT